MLSGDHACACALRASHLTLVPTDFSRPHRAQSVKRRTFGVWWCGRVGWAVLYVSRCFPRLRGGDCRNVAPPDSLCFLCSFPCSSTVVYPLDVVRRRLQTAGFVDNHHHHGPKGMLPMLRHVHQTEGFRGLFKGMSLNFIKGPIAVGISFSVFDLLKQQWGVEHVGKHK